MQFAFGKKLWKIYCVKLPKNKFGSNLFLRNFALQNFIS